MIPGTVGLGGRMSQCPLKVTIFGASTGNLGRSVVYELGFCFLVGFEPQLLAE